MTLDPFKFFKDMNTYNHPFMPIHNAPGGSGPTSQEMPYEPIDRPFTVRQAMTKAEVDAMKEGAVPASVRLKMHAEKLDIFSKLEEVNADFGGDAPCGTCGIDIADRAEKEFSCCKVADLDGRCIAKADKGKFLCCLCFPCIFSCKDAFCKPANPTNKA